MYIDIINRLDVDHHSSVWQTDRQTDRWCLLAILTTARSNVVRQALIKRWPHVSELAGYIHDWL